LFVLSPETKTVTQWRLDALYKSLASIVRFAVNDAQEAALPTLLRLDCARLVLAAGLGIARKVILPKDSGYEFEDGVFDD
jgi:hypothetical protein